MAGRNTERQKHVLKAGLNTVKQNTYSKYQFIHK